MTSEEQKHQRDILRSYLSRYRRAKNRVNKLRRRREDFIEDMKYTLGAQSYSGLPRSSAPNDGAATYLFRLCEIEERIIEQEKNANSIMLQIMDIMYQSIQRSRNGSNCLQISLILLRILYL